MIIAHDYEKRRLKMIADRCTGSSVLDVGYAQQPNPYFRGVRTVGIDLSPPSPSATTRYDEELVGDVAELRRLLPGRRFDTVVCAELIEHVENPYQLLRDCRPLIAPGGRLIVTTPNPLGFPVLVAEALRLKRVFYTKDHLYYFLPRWVERLFNASGYVVDEVTPVGLWTPWKTLPVVPAAFSYQVIYVGRPKDDSSE